MFIAVARLVLAVSNGASRKTAVHKLTDKLRHRFAASVADVEPNGPGDRGTIGIAIVASSRSHAETTIQAVIELAQRESDAHVIEDLCEVYSISELAAVGEPTLADVEGVKHALFDNRDEAVKQQRLQELREARRKRDAGDE